MSELAVVVQPEEQERVPALILEPDQWRFRGITAVLDESGKIAVVGERDYAKILTAETAPEGIPEPRVALVAHRLVVDLGLSVIPHIRDMYPRCSVLIHGEAESLEASAEILAAGGSGYYSLAAPMGYLPNAVLIASNGKLWGPREAVALMAHRVVAQKNGDGKDSGSNEDELVLLRFLNEGLSNKEIANRLQIAEVTVKARLGKLYKKYGVNTRLQLLSTAMKQGLVPPE